MRIGFLPSVTLLATACLVPSLALVSACSSSSGSTGGAVNLTFGDAGATQVGTFVTTPEGAAMIEGSFSASGDYEGQYTLSTSVPMGSPLATCLVSVDEGAPSTSVQVDASTSQTHTVTVEIGVGPGYQGQALCNVAASNNARPNIGNEVTISVSEANDGG